MKINEQFKAIQGEGLMAGLPVYFVRFSGCNNDCDFCDTKYHKNGNDYTVKELVNDIRNSKMETIVMTGGEPLLQIDKIVETMSYLPKHDFHLETNGSIYNDKVKNFKWINCSPKKEQIHNLDSYNRFRMLPQTIFKFVYESKENKWWEQFIEDAQIDKHSVWIMPEGASREEQIKKMPEVMEYCLKNNFKFGARLHVLAYDTRRGV